MKQLAFDFFNAEPITDKQTGEGPLRRQPRLPKAPPDFEKRESFTLTPAFSYRLERVKRKTVGFVIDERGLTIRAPRWVSVADIEKMIQKREDWIQKKLVQFANWQKEVGTQAVRFEDGQSIPYLGKPLTMVLDPKAPTVYKNESEHEPRLIVNLSKNAAPERIRDLVQVWFRKEAERYIGERLKAIAAKALVSYSGRGLSSAKGRWGSCSADRKIRLNWRLIHLDPSIIDYVISHELAHLDEMNHSARFWKRVAEIDPNYSEARQKLKGIYIPTLPF